MEVVQTLWVKVCVTTSISILDNFCKEKPNLIVKKYSRKEKIKYI